MTCNKALTLVPLLLDGQLESPQSRALMIHSTSCTPCDTELRELQRLRKIVNESILARVDDMDLSTFWPRIESRLRTQEASWRQRLRTWWDQEFRHWMAPAPAFATVAIIAVLAILAFLLRGPQVPIGQPAAQFAAADTATTTIQSLESDAVLSPFIVEQIAEPVRP